ncbi:DUF7003 family protein [Flavobacterium akiainvivens]|uniref:DUF7003 family protein n=1 Tax=Flavobacterium akiainvivens TaxID=1202724 RepID=UPI0006C8B292|nr:hypothetical protein [Flavobacterium akiainvivens]SFQ62396.1 hypothetical protein SAMN05444144_110119 [Flavobacterium akiainvivens]
MLFTEREILQELDLAIAGKAGSYYPHIQEPDIAYNFPPDLEHGYFLTAGSRIHLFADEANWAIVFEKSGFNNRGAEADAELYYYGNCINYSITVYPERQYITNVLQVPLISFEEYERIQAEGDGFESFERISKNITHINIKGQEMPFESDYKKYEAVGISIQDEDNPDNLIGFGEIIRYLHETSPQLISATDAEIREPLPDGLPKLLTINEFHFTSAYDESTPPSEQELYRLIARVLVTRNPAEWQPTREPNNHWSNWESGNL